jgi:hypothetical protein
MFPFTPTTARALKGLNRALATLKAAEAAADRKVLAEERLIDKHFARKGVALEERDRATRVSATGPPASARNSKTSWRKD